VPLSTKSTTARGGCQIRTRALGPGTPRGCAPSTAAKSEDEVFNHHIFKVFIIQFHISFFIFQQFHKLIFFHHPTSPPACSTPRSAGPPMLEFFFDTPVPRRLVAQRHGRPDPAVEFISPTPGDLALGLPTVAGLLPFAPVDPVVYVLPGGPLHFDGRVPGFPPARRAAHAHDARAPALRERLTPSPRSSPRSAMERLASRPPGRGRCRPLRANTASVPVARSRADSLLTPLEKKAASCLRGECHAA